MKILKILLTLVLITMVLTPIFSLNINILGEVSEYSKNYKETVLINLNCGEKLTLDLPNTATNSKFDNQRYYNSTITIKDCNKTNIISYNLNKQVEFISNDQMRIERQLGSYKGVNYTFSLKIPLDFSVVSNKTIPNNFKVILENNQKIVEFQKNDFYLVYLKDNKVINTQITTKHLSEELKEPIVLTSMFLTFLVGVFFSYFYFRKSKTEEFIAEKMVPAFVLSKEEKLIIDVIAEMPGINQKQIGVELNYSKARVSSIINDLEQKKLIKREKFGRSFKVFIDNKVMKE